MFSEFHKPIWHYGRTFNVTSIRKYPNFLLFVFFFSRNFQQDTLNFISKKLFWRNSLLFFRHANCIFFKKYSLTDSRKTLLKFSVICFALFAKKIIVLIYVPVNSSITKYSMLQVVSKNIWYKFIIKSQDNLSAVSLSDWIFKQKKAYTLFKTLFFLKAYQIPHGKLQPNNKKFTQRRRK